MRRIVRLSAKAIALICILSLPAMAEVPVELDDIWGFCFEENGLWGCSIGCGGEVGPCECLGTGDCPP